MSSQNNLMDELKQYKELLDLGVVTEAEYNQKKKQILDSVQSDNSSTSNNYKQNNEGINMENSMYSNNSSGFTNNSSKTVISSAATRVLSYLGLLWLVAYFLGDKNERFHLNQGLALMVTDVIVGVINVVLQIVAVLTNTIIIYGIIILSICAFLLVCIVKGISNAVNNVEEELPIIGGMRFLK